HGHASLAAVARELRRELVRVAREEVRRILAVADEQAEVARRVSGERYDQEPTIAGEVVRASEGVGAPERRLDEPRLEADGPVLRNVSAQEPGKAPRALPLDPRNEHLSAGE